MCCYIVPAVAAIVHSFMRKKIPSMKSSQHRSLNLLFLGGAIFGVVDHWWNGELFLIGENLAKDLALGAAITLTILAVWGIMLIHDKMAAKAPAVN